MRGKKIVYKGHSYSSINELAKLLNLDKARFRYYLEKSGNPEEAVEATLRSKKRRPVFYRGRAYRSLRELSAEIGVSGRTLQHYLEKGAALDEIDARGPKGVFYRGRSYPSLKKLSVDLGIGYQRLLYRLRKGCSLEEAVAGAVDSQLHPHQAAGRGELSYAGKTYGSLAELARDTGVTYDKIVTRIRRGYSVEEAVEGKAPPIEYGGKRYASLKQLAKDAQISYECLRYRVRSGWGLERAVETPAKKRMAV